MEKKNIILNVIPLTHTIIIVLDKQNPNLAEYNFNIVLFTTKEI